MSAASAKQVTDTTDTTDTRRRRPTRFRLAPGSIRSFTIGCAAVAAVLGLWWAAASLQLLDPLFLPPPAQVWDAFISASTDGYRGYLLWEHLGISLRRIGLGFAFGVVTGVPLGLLVGVSRTSKAIVDPFVNFYRPLPPLGYYTLLVVWFGIGEMSKNLLLFLTAFPPIFIATVEGVRNVRVERVDAARSLGAGRFQALVHVVFPSVLPDIFTGMRVSIGITFTTVVAAEIVAADSGVGFLVLDASRFLRTDYVFMGIIVMGITGIVLDGAIRVLQRWAVPWQGRG